MATTIPYGQTPLTDNPYAGKHGKAADDYNQAFQAFVNQFGRNPTSEEIGMALPAFKGTDPHITDTTSGNAWLANYQAQLTAPTAIQLQQQQKQQGLDVYNAKADTYNQQLGSLWQSLLGRAPTSQELTHFGSLLASGQTDPYELQQYLQQTPEYANAKDAQFRQQLGGQLNDINSQFFSKYIQPSVMSGFASQGRDISGLSTALQYALANSAKDLQLQSQQYLAGLGAQQYQGRQDVATQDYQSRLGQQMGVQNTSLGNSISNQNNLLGQGWASANYGRQSNDLMNYLNAQSSRNSGNPMGGALSGALGGAMLGSKFGPYGALAGGVGGGLFGYGAGGGF